MYLLLRRLFHLECFSRTAVIAASEAERSIPPGDPRRLLAREEGLRELEDLILGYHALTEIEAQRTATRESARAEAVAKAVAERRAAFENYPSRSDRRRWLDYWRDTLGAVGLAERMPNSGVPGRPPDVNGPPLENEMYCIGIRDHVILRAPPAVFSALGKKYGLAKTLSWRVGEFEVRTYFVGGACILMPFLGDRLHALVADQKPDDAVLDERRRVVLSEDWIVPPAEALPANSLNLPSVPPALLEILSCGNGTPAASAMLERHIFD